MGRGEIILNQLTADLLNIKVGDTVNLSIPGLSAFKKAFDIKDPEPVDNNIVTLDGPPVHNIFSSNKRLRQGSSLDAGEEPTLLPFTVMDLYDDPSGKFSIMFRNVAVLDCHPLLDQIVDYLDTQIQLIPDPDKKSKANTVLSYVRMYVSYTNTTLCDFAYSLEGRLPD